MTTRQERFVDTLVPPRLGAGFRWLLASSWVSNLGDGIALAAGPLLVASQTREPFLIALATLLQRLPWLLFGLLAGVMADQYDRRMLIVAVNLVRSALLVGLSVVIVTDTVNVAIVLVALFVFGTCEAFADITGGTLLPMLVDKADIGIGNARLMFGRITVNRLAGPPVGAALFAAGMALPFVADAVVLALAALLAIQLGPLPGSTDTARRSMRSEVAAGIRWLWRHPPLRTLTLTILAFNVTFGAAWSVLVLYVIEHLGMGEFGFGVVTATTAAGGVVGTVSFGPLERHVPLATLMRVGLTMETLTHIALANVSTAGLALPVFFLFGLQAAVWGTLSSSIRQRAVPTELQGRVGSVYMVGVHGGLAVGAGLGGIIADIGGITAPYWFAFFGSAAILATIWRELTHVAHAG